MGSRSDLLRRAALIAAGALALHELRYRVGYGDAAGAAAAEHGHAYMSWAWAGVVALVVAAACGFVLSLAVEFRRMYGPAPSARGGGFTRSWLSVSLALSAIYSVQELAEGWFAHGHPVGLEAVAGHAGWSAYVLALAVGALVTLALRGARRALALAGRPSSPEFLPRPSARLPRPALLLPLPRAGVLALNLAGRAPPASR